MAALYQSFLNGNAGRPVNPIFYISSSPWNLYDLLRDFLELNEIPRGPIFLRDLGVDQTKFIKRSGHGEKLERALQIMSDFPELPFVLVGDSAQHDAGLYAEAAALEKYLPAQVDPEEIRVAVKTAIAGGATQIGAVMGKVLPQFKGRADGSTINAIAREELSKQG